MNGNVWIKIIFQYCYGLKMKKLFLQSLVEIKYLK